MEIETVDVASLLTDIEQRSPDKTTRGFARNNLVGFVLPSPPTHLPSGSGGSCAEQISHGARRGSNSFSPGARGIGRYSSWSDKCFAYGFCVQHPSLLSCSGVRHTFQLHQVSQNVC